MLIEKYGGVYQAVGRSSESHPQSRSLYLAERVIQL